MKKEPPAAAMPATTCEHENVVFYAKSSLKSLHRVFCMDCQSLVWEEAAKGQGNMNCASAEDCAGSPDDRLIQHFLNGQPGDIYCSTCWESFRLRLRHWKGYGLRSAHKKC